jgi:RNA polymerase sigma-70 factor (ECF subfamily)
VTATPVRAKFEDLLTEQIPVMRAVARRLTRNPKDAEDLVQDASLRAYRFFEGFEPGTNFRAWILRILKNVFINEWHRKQAIPPTDSIDDDESPWERHMSELSGSRALGDPEVELGRTLLGEDIDAAIVALPIDFRMVVTLCLVEGLSYQEAADALEIPIGTVMSRLFRGRRLLQARLLDNARARGFGGAAAAAEVAREEGTP